MVSCARTSCTSVISACYSRALRVEEGLVKVPCGATRLSLATADDASGH